MLWHYRYLGLYPELLKPLFVFKLYINCPAHLVRSLGTTSAMFPKRMGKLWSSPGACAHPVDCVYLMSDFITCVSTSFRVSKVTNSPHSEKPPQIPIFLFFLFKVIFLWMRVTTVSCFGAWITLGWLILFLLEWLFACPVLKAVTIKVQKHKLLYDDSSDFLIILLNKINS